MSTLPHENSLKQAISADARFNRGIHGARGLFAFLVVLFHVSFSKLPAPVSASLTEAYSLATSSLAYGVDLFFVISGIVIMGAFRRAPSISAFLWDRITRIFPVLWVTVLVMFVLNLIGKNGMGDISAIHTFGYLIGNLFAMPPIIHIPIIHPAAWSLSYEFAFYLLFAIFGLVSVLLPRRVAIVAIGILAIFIFWHHIRAIYFVAGLLIASGWVSRSRLNSLTYFPLLWMILFFVAWQAVAVRAGGNIHAAVLETQASDPLMIGLTAIAFLSALLTMAGIDQSRGLLSRFLQMPTMQWLGTMSFSLYLWQTPIMAIVKQVLIRSGLVELAGVLSQPLLLLVCLPPILYVSYLSQRYLEQKAMRWLRGLVERRRIRNAAPSESY